MEYFMFQCPYCGNLTRLNLDGEEGKKAASYSMRKCEGLRTGLVQEELPFLDAKTRELFITGM